MTITDSDRREIKGALAKLPGSEFFETVTDLLNTLGYKSALIPPDIQSNSVDDFIRQYGTKTSDTKAKQLFKESVKSIRILFQFTDQEITDQGSLFNTAGFDTNKAQSFFFVAVELKDGNYPRGKYASFVREINKCWQIPTIVLFRTSTDLLTLAFVDRRRRKRGSGPDVLDKVSLIREIKPAAPHHAHVAILAELSLKERLQWIDNNREDHNFDGLKAAWLDALDTEELNRDFYRELLAWFKRAEKEAHFPNAGAKVRSAQKHVIRLITRLLFIWFIKEKDLVAEELFIEDQVRELLKDYDSENGDSYYRAVLQNLFFATLNTEIDRRQFSQKSNTTHRDFSLYRYASEIANPDRLKKLFQKTPFINGGLFDCLDSFDATGTGGYRIDYFSDNILRPGSKEYKKLSIPNNLFFDHEGLITLFNRYKFTVEENTPVEQEVALDPELLGKVFENLLAAHTPETEKNARKQTGSYYTPRSVVDYMVDEALVAALVQKVPPHRWCGWKKWKKRLHNLFNYKFDDNDAGDLFSTTDKARVVQAIAELRVLDPAVGSGAFPMGVLHKLTLALRRLDPDNQLSEISRTFDRYSNSDFGRKLYLIQNSIYGVDIQPVAIQIAKLRFFISLAIEQQPTADKNNNYGIHPLPNLETRFVAADTLLGLGQAIQIPLGGQNEVTNLNDQLRQNREAHFNASHRQEKLDLRNEDDRLRKELEKELEKAGMSKSDAGKVADWDPYDQNEAAGWFDAGYMFNVHNGFDVVIGNPPYVEARSSLLSTDTKEAYMQQVHTEWGANVKKGSDLLIYFLARSAKMLSSEGFACLITQNAWLSTNYGKAFQTFAQGKFSFHRIVDTSAKFFSDVQGPNINCIIAFFSQQSNEDIEYSVVDAEMLVTTVRTIRAQQEMKWGHLFAMPEFLEGILEDLRGMEDQTLRDRIEFGQGINVRKDHINAPGANVPALSTDAQFVAMVADSAVLSSSIGSRAKVPALILPRGIGRHYCTFNSCKAYSHSCVELYLPHEMWESDLHYCLWAFLNSSVVWLFREVTGRRNLGGGMLKAEATDMKTLPIGFDFDFADVARDLYSKLQHRDPLAVKEEICTIEHLKIDEIVERYLGISKYSRSIKDALLERVALRESRAKHRH